jgi:hypothetical protein
MNDNQLQIVSFEQAQRLKALGFEWETKWFYRDNIPSPTDTLLYQPNDSIGDHNACIHKFSAPTVALALKWFRNTKRLFGYVEKNIIADVDEFWFCTQSDNGSNPTFSEYGESFDTYEAAESAMLNGLLTLLEKEK